MAQLFISVAALIHFYIFVMESILWGKPRINKVFGMPVELAEQNRLFAFNQGYYNLFLSISALTGVALSIAGNITIGITLMTYASASMLGASIVLFYSQRKLIRPALMQGVPPLLGLISLGVKILVIRIRIDSE